MSNLIKNELIKTLHKRSTLVMLIILFSFVLLITFFYSRSTDSNVDKNLSSTNWKEQILLQKQEVETDLVVAKNELKASDYASYITLTNKIEYFEYLQKLYNYRILNNIGFNNSFLDNAINELVGIKEEHIALKNTVNRSESDIHRFNELNELVLKDEYILHNKIDINSSKSVSKLLQNFYDEYLLFILIFIIIISAPIISDEFNKGTIKTLLTTPYSRTEIIIAKIFSVFIVLVLTTVSLIIAQYVVGGLIFGFATTNMPILIYNNISQSLVVVSSIKYIFLNTISNMTLCIMVALIAIMFSVLSSSTAIATGLSFFSLIASDIMNALIIKYDIAIFRYVLTLNWNLTCYLFGNNHPFKYLSFIQSFIIYMAYLLIILVIIIKVFKTKKI